MKEIITGIIIFGLIILAVVLLKGPIKPDLSSDGGYDPRTENCGPGGTPC